MTKSESQAKSTPKIITWGELQTREIPVRKHLIVPWLREGESAMVYAAVGVGKSLFALSVGITVAGMGKLLNTWETGKEPRKVLYIDGEMPLDDIKDRMEVLCKANGDIDDNALKENFLLMARQDQGPEVQFIDLAKEATQEFLIDKIVEDHIDLVILDNLSTLATIDDENSASAFNDVVKFLLKMKQTGCACLLVHHAAKNTSQYRGSSKIATTFEVIIKLESLNSREGDRFNTTRFSFCWEKYRGKRDENTGHNLEVALEAPSDGKDTESVWSTCTSEEAENTYILEMLRSGSYCTNKELAAALGISEATMTRKKQGMIKSGLITEKEWTDCLKNIQGESSIEF